jgi:uncharacterized cofD-like protein
MLDAQLTVIGGGGGAAQVLIAARSVFTRRSAVLTVTDSGRSTGTARELFAMPAPGDIRNTLAVLAADPHGPLAQSVQYRLHQPQLPQLAGMALGNLLLGALTEIAGDLAAATRVLAEVLAVPETIVPVSVDNSALCADLSDGTQRHGELAVRGLAKPAIRRLWLEPPARLHPAAAREIAAADLLLIGPGSFYTSLLAALATDGLVEALRAARGRCVFVCNTTTQPGQTDGMRVVDHVTALVEQLGPGVLDTVLINDTARLDAQRREAFAAAGLQPLDVDAAQLVQIRALGVEPLVIELAEAPGADRRLWNKLDTIRHDPARLTAALRALVG